MSEEVTEADVDRQVAAAFGRKADATDPEKVALFREAGFSEADAVKGAVMMESGRYFGFEDVATSMLMSRFDNSNRLRHPHVTESRIAEVAKKAAGPDVSEGGQS